MQRYSSTSTTTSPTNLKIRYTTTRYPEISRGKEDIYVYVTKGDRVDILAQIYYNDSTLWWIISKSNPNAISFDTLYFTPGDQIRIPSPLRISNIISNYESLNQN